MPYPDNLSPSRNSEVELDCKCGFSWLAPARVDLDDVYIEDRHKDCGACGGRAI